MVKHAKIKIKYKKSNFNSKFSNSLFFQNFFYTVFPIKKLFILKKYRKFFLQAKSHLKALPILSKRAAAQTLLKQKRMLAIFKSKTSNVANIFQKKNISTPKIQQFNKKKKRKKWTAPYLKFKFFSQKSMNNKNQNVLSLRYYIRLFLFWFVVLYSNFLNFFFKIRFNLWLSYLSKSLLNYSFLKFNGFYKHTDFGLSYLNVLPFNSFLIFFNRSAILRGFSKLSTFKIKFATPFFFNYFLVRPQFSAFKYKTWHRRKRAQRKLLLIKSLKTRILNSVAISQKFSQKFRSFLNKRQSTVNKIKKFYRSRYIKFHKATSYLLPKLFNLNYILKRPNFKSLSLAFYLRKFKFKTRYFTATSYKPRIFTRFKFLKLLARKVRQYKKKNPGKTLDSRRFNFNKAYKYFMTHYYVDKSAKKKKQPTKVRVVKSRKLTKYPRVDAQKIFK